MKQKKDCRKVDSGVNLNGNTEEMTNAKYDALMRSTVEAYARERSMAEVVRGLREAYLCRGMEDYDEWEELTGALVTWTDALASLKQCAWSLFLALGGEWHEGDHLLNVVEELYYERFDVNIFRNGEDEEVCL